MVLTETQKKSHDGWEITELKDVVDINPESRDPSQKPLEKFSYIDIDAVENGSGVINTVKELIGTDAPSRARRVVRTDDVIMSEVRPYLKAFALVPKKLNNQICSTGFAVLRSKRTIDPRYLLNVLFSNEVIDQCTRMMVGAQYPALNDSQVKKILVPLPPLPEQRRIATILAAVDDAIQRSRQAAAETERLKAGVMQELMTKGIGHTEFRNDPDVGRIPIEWDVVRLISVLSEKTKYGYSGKEVKGGSKVRVLTLSAVTNNDISEKNSKECTHDPAQIKEYWIKKDDIFIGRSNTRELVGLTAIYRGTDPFTIFADLLIRVRSDKTKITPDFLSYYLVSDYVRNYFAASSKGTSGSMKKIDTSIIEELKVRLPTIPEQQQISTILSTLDHKLSFQRQRTAHYDRLKQGLMNELLTGKRRVKVT
jgi:type I restriction enzyme S subunit